MPTDHRLTRENRHRVAEYEFLRAGGEWPPRAALRVGFPSIRAAVTTLRHAERADAGTELEPYLYTAPTEIIPGFEPPASTSRRPVGPAQVHRERELIDAKPIPFDLPRGTGSEHKEAIDDAAAWVRERPGTWYRVPGEHATHGITEAWRRRGLRTTTMSSRTYGGRVYTLFVIAPMEAVSDAV
jgi:hypothetical protein